MANAEAADWQLRVLRDEDLAPLMEVRNDPAVQDSLVGTNLTMDSEGARAWMACHLNAPNRYLRVVELNDRAVGYASLVVVDALAGVASYNVVLGLSAQGQRIGLGTTERLLSVAFNRMGLRRVQLDVLASNDRARNLYLKLGFVDEGRRRKAVFKGGEYVDVVMMALLRDEWRDVAH